MSEEKDFVDGMIVKRPHENAPDFIKANISIKLDDFKGWIGQFVKAIPAMSGSTSTLKNPRRVRCTQSVIPTSLRKSSPQQIRNWNPPRMMIFLGEFNLPAPGLGWQSLPQILWGFF